MTEVLSRADLETARQQQRTRVSEHLIRLNGKGEMVSILNPCWCGEGKNVWHGVH